VISGGGYQDVYGTTSGATVSSGGIEVVESGATASATTVQSGGEIIIYAGATVSGLVVNGGTVVSSGGASPAAATQQTAVTYATSASSSVTSSSSATRDLAPTIESTVANLIQAMASFHAGTSQGALFEPAIGGLWHEETATLVVGHRLTSRP
jgi:autotransporter passenger strand-loop-strand repeat protein